MENKVQQAADTVEPAADSAGEWFPNRLYGESVIFEAIDTATEGFKGVLNELQRDQIGVDTVVELRKLPVTQPPAPPMEWSKDKVLPDGYYWMRLSPDDNAPTIIRNEGQVFEECGMEGDVRYTNNLTTAEFCPVSLPAPATQTYETTLALAAEIAHLTATRYSKGTFNDCSREARACEEIETAIRGLITSPPAPMATRDEVLELAARECDNRATKLSIYIEDEYYKRQEALLLAANIRALKSAPAQPGTTATGRSQALRDAIEAIDKLTVSENFSGHWQNGFNQAQCEAIEAVRKLISSAPDAASRQGDGSQVRWSGMTNLYRAITGKECDESVALGMATSAVSSMLAEMSRLKELNRQFRADNLQLMENAAVVAKEGEDNGE